MAQSSIRQITRDRERDRDRRRDPGRLLVIVDDAPFRRQLLDTAAELELDARQEDDPARAIVTFRTNWLPHLVVFDQLLPRPEFYIAASALRSTFGATVVAISSDPLTTGAPLEPGVLLESRQAALAEVHRLAGDDDSPQLLNIGRLAIDTAAHVALLDRHDLLLTGDEFSTLAALMRSEGRVVTRRALLAALGGFPRDLDPRVVDVHVVRLMVKLGPAAPVAIERSHDREGYILKRL